MTLSFRASLSLPLAALLLTAAGCMAPPKADGPTTARLEANRETVRAAAVDVLQRLRFEVERPQRSPERIDTLPMVSAYPLEFWREDVRTCYGEAETALHTVRRTVVVTMVPPGPQEQQDAGLDVTVEVRRERISLPDEPTASSAAEAYSVFSTERGMLSDFEKHWGRGLAWVDDGRDPALEELILQRIRSRL